MSTGLTIKSALVYGFGRIVRSDLRFRPVPFTSVGLLLLYSVKFGPGAPVSVSLSCDSFWFI